MQATRLSTILLVAILVSATASAQVFDSGPSDPSLFDTVVSLPGDPVFADSIDSLQSFGNFDGSATPTIQFNVADGGSLGQVFNAFSGVEVNISGGLIRSFFRALIGSEVNISGGDVRDAFRASPGSVVNISGGTFGSSFRVFSGSTVNLLGSDFALDGVLLDNIVPGEALIINDRDVTLSGLLDDGSTFSFDLNSEFDGVQDFFESGSALTVTSTSVPEPTSMVILLLGSGLAGMRRIRSAA